MFLHSLLVGTSFLGIGALRAEILVLKAHICIHATNRTLMFRPKQILKVNHHLIFARAELTGVG